MGWNDPLPPGYIVEGTVKPSVFAFGLGLMVPFMPLALANLKLMLFGAFGLGPLQFDASVQLKAALGVNLSWNPSAAIMANAQVGLALSGLIPNFSIHADIAVGLQLKIGGIQLLLNLGLGLTAAIPNFILALNAFFALPGCYFAVFNGPVGQMKAPVQWVPGMPGLACMVVGVGYANQQVGASFVTGIGGLFTTAIPAP